MNGNSLSLSVLGRYDDDEYPDGPGWDVSEFVEVLDCSVIVSLLMLLFELLLVLLVWLLLVVFSDALFRVNTGFNRSMDTVVDRPEMSMIKYLSCLEMTRYGPSYGGVKALCDASRRTRTCEQVARSLKMKTFR